MKKTVIGLMCLMGLMRPMVVSAQTGGVTPTLTAALTPDSLTPDSLSPDSLLLSPDSLLLSPDSLLPTPYSLETKDRLEQILDNQRIGPLGLTNFLQHAIRQAVSRGVPANTMVLLLLFPLVATLIAAARHFLGLRGFGVFTPAVLSIVFLATGLQLGLTLFLGILAFAVLGRIAIRRLRLQYLPHLAMLVWVMSLGILLLFVFAPGLGLLGELGGLGRLGSIGIFPILLLVLLTETFISAQISHGAKNAAKMTAETLVLAIVSYFLMSMNATQSWVLIHPELTILALAAGNILLGQFTGLRMLEYWRFRELLRK